MTNEELKAKILEQEQALKICTAKVREFRENNIILLKTVKALKAKFKGVDVDKYNFLKKEKE